MGHYGQSRTPGQGQDTIFAIIRVIGVAAKAMSLLSSESSERMPFGPFSPVGLCPTLPIFLKLPKLSPSLLGRYGQSQTPGQGQDIGECRVLLSLFDENECVAAYSALRRSYSWRNFFNCLLCVASQLLMAKLFPLLLLLVASDDAADAEYTFDAVEHFLSEIAFYFATRQTLVGRNR